MWWGEFDRRTPVEPVLSHTVHICPVFECNARTVRAWDRLRWDCVNGHRLNDEDLARGIVRPLVLVR